MIKKKEINVYVGHQIRDRRVLLGMTQADLARRLDLSYQQVQKYEAADNQVSFARLLEIAEALSIDMAYFTPPSIHNIHVDELEHAGKERGKISLIRNFECIADQKVRQTITQLVGSLAEQHSAA